MDWQRLLHEFTRFCENGIDNVLQCNEIMKNLKGERTMKQLVKLTTDGLLKLREMNPRLVSYNVEMTEVTGGIQEQVYVCFHRL